MITADAGGSNSYRFRAWKAGLAALAADTRPAITVCHFPPGTSKWKKIEHRLFSRITMNWRGRLLTTHEVVVNAIPSTTTRTGLRVRAELDDRPYPLGITVSRARMETLPLEPHKTRRAWNYTLRPETAEPTGHRLAPGSDRAATPALLDDPRLTGIAAAELDTLAKRLAVTQQAQWEQQRYEARGGARRQRPGTHGKKPLLSGRDRILITLIYLRQVCSQRVLCDLLEINDRTIGQTVTDTEQLLADNKIPIESTTMLFSEPAQLLTFIQTGQLATRSREPLPEALSDPAITGMTRAELNALVERLSVRQAALVERRRQQRRGGPRQPGASGGVFSQRITDTERTLAAVLFHRQVCTGEALAELFQVSRSTIGNVFRDVRPLLKEDGVDLPQAPIKHRTAADLLAAAASPSTRR